MNIVLCAGRKAAVEPPKGTKRRMQMAGRDYPHNDVCQVRAGHSTADLAFAHVDVLDLVVLHVLAAIARDVCCSDSSVSIDLSLLTRN